jgi:hypothetical protein
MLTMPGRRLRRTLAIGATPVLGLTLLVGSTPSMAAEPTASGGPGTPTLIAEGPFGRVAGVADGAMPDHDVLPVLDAWARGATFALRPSEGILSPWRAVLSTEPDLDRTRALELRGDGDGDASITMRSTGLFLMRVDGTIRPDGDAIQGTWWWRVAVPERDLPVDGSGPPPPAIHVVSGDDEVVLEQGSGCYVGTCGDIGGISPADQLPTVQAIAGAPLSVWLSDGSGMVGWSVSAVPVGGSPAETRVLGQGDGWTTHAWVPAPPAGDWVLQVSVTFDRERGSFDGYGRLTLDPAPVP